ncbi:hypothetical protein DXG01_013342 [Tephrocybe rancida]|nr:hypothetical protein DXG01_013342 [Tephrocybe rancida]
MNIATTGPGSLAFTTPSRQSPYPRLALYLKMAGVIGTGTMKKSFSSILPDIRIISRVIGPILTVTIFASLVAYAQTQGYRMVQTNSIVPLLSVVARVFTGIIPRLRAYIDRNIHSTSYDRYWEGRKSFASLSSNIRNLTRQIWVSVVLPSPDGQPPTVKGKIPASEVTASQLRRRKVEALKLSLSFAFAVKHYLRGEDGTRWDDFDGVLPSSFDRFDEVGFNVEHTTTAPPRSYSAININNDSDSAERGSRGSSPERARPDATKRVRRKRSKQMSGSMTPVTPLLGSTHRTVEFHAYADEASLPLPLVIATELTRILFNFRREGFLETVGPAGKFLLQHVISFQEVDGVYLFKTLNFERRISSMTDQLTAMERVANTPIPVSYGIHLKQCVTLYLFALPFTLVNDLGWATVPIVTVVAFTFMGIEGIADEIEMPFGTDDRDLPIDRYCQDLKEEINYVIERMPEGGEGLHGYDDGEGDD